MSHFKPFDPGYQMDLVETLLPLIMFKAARGPAAVQTF